MTGRCCYVTMEVAYSDSVAKSGVTLQYRSSIFRMESVIALCQNVRYDNDNL